jgi:serine/threonine protein kinase
MEVTKTIDCFEGKNFNIGAFREICFLNSFKSNLIPKVIDTVITNISSGHISYKQEYMGITIKTWIQTMNIHERIKVFPSVVSQLINIILFLQKHNIVHLDIKPENFCIDNNGKISIIDFGLSSFEGLKCNEVTYGTTVYTNTLSKKTKISSSQDIFALGLMLYNFLYNKFDWTYDELLQCHNYEDLYEMLQINSFGEMDTTIKELLSGSKSLKTILLKYNTNNTYHETITKKIKYTVSKDIRKSKIYNNIVEKASVLLLKLPVLVKESQAIFKKWSKMSKSYWTEESIKIRMISCFFTLYNILYYNDMNARMLIRNLDFSCRSSDLLAYSVKLLYDINFELWGR